MITPTLRVMLLLAIAVYFALVFHLLKKKSLNLKYTLLWLLSGCIMLVLALFPVLLEWMANLFGIRQPTNALFAAVFFCVIIILMSLTAIVSKQNERIKRLIQSQALLEKRLRELECSNDSMQQPFEKEQPEPDSNLVKQ